VITVALRGLAGRKLRASLTAFAIILGVAMVSGTFVLTDTIKRAFNSISTQAYQNSDAVITGKVAFKNTDSSTENAPSFPANVLTKVRALPDVEAAEGSIADEAKFVGHDGKVITSTGAPNLAFSVDPKSDQRFNPLDLVSGSWPNAPDQVAMDRATASDNDFKVGDTVGIATQGPVRPFQISGIVKFSDISIGGATIAVFDTPTAQRLFGKRGEYDVIRVDGKAGVSTSKLLSQIRPLLPPTAQVKSATEQVDDDASETSGFTSFLQYFLLAFGGVALFVGSFVIANTLSITIAQRMRELATLRTLGATRRQVRRSVLLESLIVGVLASLAGLFLGLALAKFLNWLFVKFGIDLPTTGTVFKTRTIIVALIVGIGVTLLASLRPAFRATRVPPIAAVREGAVLPPSRLARFGLVTSLIVLALGVALLLYGVFASGIPAGTRILALLIGMLLLFFGVALNAPRVIRPLAYALGWPGTQIGGSAGELARRNAMRNPGRTASTAAALMIGLALVTFVGILGAGLRASFNDAVDKLFVADYALTAQNGFDPFTIEADPVVARQPDVEVVSPIREGDGRAFGKTIFVTAVDKNMSKVVDADWYRGNDSVPARLGRNGAFVEKDYAKDHHLSIGSPIRVETPTARLLNLHIVGIYKSPKGGSPFGDVTFSTPTYDANYSQKRNLMTLINTKGGVDDANTEQLKSAVAGFPDAKLQTRDQFKKNQGQFIDRLLNLLYVLLGLSILVSVFGIVNTLVLTVFERTRELGMLRAVGMTRRQVRQMIRHESVVTALIGAAFGLVLGFFLAAIVTTALSDEGVVFAVPYLSLVIFVIAAIIVGVLAAILPARRASRIRVLQALQYE
jgi:putative ABC transport system permease protein